MWIAIGLFFVFRSQIIGHSDSESVRRRKFWNDYCQTGNTIKDEKGEVVICVVGRDKKEADWDAQEKLFCGSVLVAIVDLFPHGQVIISAGIEFKGYSGNVVEHYVAANDIGDVCESPAEFLSDAGNEVINDF